MKNRGTDPRGECVAPAEVFLPPEAGGIGEHTKNSRGDASLGGLPPDCVKIPRKERTVWNSLGLLVQLTSKS